ncbi:dihydroorotase [Bifidobacterium sp. UTCIF-3]|uniref:dihydroorotase n=1 Tax=unclassified Bifidobacterium TaxID=2608897 RepID=UPI00112AACD7|nr:MULTISPECIES: dihydroorotase [unclassified Bifidobacterium]TPF78735.1 dihydroorotase [Bifidobacterium sp. UTCIF-1]TPF82283.1 dihydroorotase [Bifidobacterium sp. UTCIF-3]TPF84561.1 dihydroorotase [Bifidobacterium sp. UTCIF-36]TPF93917.1 dihydroorotase [Bifidobacterium sp. UTBIF-68]
MSITLRNIKVWNTGEIIDLTVPGLADAYFADTDTVRDGADIDATGLTLGPGFADPHVHFRDPGQTYKESMVSGCRASASGGYTNVLIMPNTLPALDGQAVTTVDAEAGKPGAREVVDAGFANVIDFLQNYDAAHDVKLPVRYDLCVCASKDRAGAEASDISDWLRYVPGFQDDAKTPAMNEHPVTAISDDGAAVPEPILDQVLANAKASDLYLIEHCEHHDTGAVNEGPVSRNLGVPGIPEDTELKIVTRDIEAARRTGIHVHFQHVSTAISFEAIRKAKAEGLPVTCETAPHYLALSDEALLEYGTLAKMNPPLRSEADRQATIAAIADGTVDLLATDHAPHTMDEKAKGFLEAPNGIIGLECAYGVCHKVLVDGGHISDERLIELMSVAPQALMGHDATDIAALVEDWAEPAPTGDDPDGVIAEEKADSSQTAREGVNRLLDLSRVDDASVVDLVVLATDRPWTVDPERFHSKARNTPFGGWQVTGRPLATIIGSKFMFSRL